MIWGTKARHASMLGSAKDQICKHIKANAAEKGIHVDTVNGTADHLHLLVGMKPEQSASQIANLLKGESSHWVNENRVVQSHFSWQEGFSAFSVSASQLERVRQYIRNQEEHHRKMTFQEELEVFFRKYGIEYRRP